MDKLSLFSLPLPSTAAIQEPKLTAQDNGSLFLTMICDDEGRNQTQGVLFIKPRAFRQRAEKHCALWHIENVYDTVCEISESDWIDELRRDTTPDWRDYWVMRHFMIYVDSFGCLEVVAESAVLDEAGVKNSGGT